MKPKNPQHYPKDAADVLIALAAQESEPVEQAPSPEELADFFENSKRFPKERQEAILAYLDSDPQAYERWIRHGKRSAQSERAPSLFAILPYAFAACAALLLIGTVLMWRGKVFELDQAIDRAYQTAFFGDDREGFQRTMASLADSLKQSEQPLGFSGSEQSSPLAQAFILGLKHDWQKLSQQTSEGHPPADAQQEDYQLGRWHTLLWTVSQQNKVMPEDFWQEQLGILDHLKTHYAGHAEDVSTTEVEAVALQLERMQTVLQQLAEDSQATKPYRQLEQRLTALRYSLMPLL